MPQLTAHRSFDCYLIGELQGATIVRLRTCGESAWGMTHVDRTEYVDLLHSTGRSYTEAENHLALQYDRLYPALSRILAFPRQPRPPNGPIVAHQVRRPR